MKGVRRVGRFYSGRYADGVAFGVVARNRVEAMCVASLTATGAASLLEQKLEDVEEEIPAAGCAFVKVHGQWVRAHGPNRLIPVAREPAPTSEVKAKKKKKVKRK